METKLSYCLPASARVKKRSEIVAIQAGGARLFTKHFLLRYLPAHGSESRIAITITKKNEPSAVRRNLLKRRIRELFRQSRPAISPAQDIVIIARDGACDISFADMRAQIVGALRKGGLLAG